MWARRWMIFWDVVGVERRRCVGCLFILLLFLPADLVTRGGRRGVPKRVAGVRGLRSIGMAKAHPRFVELGKCCHDCRAGSSMVGCFGSNVIRCCVGLGGKGASLGTCSGEGLRGDQLISRSGGQTFVIDSGKAFQP